MTHPRWPALLPQAVSVAGFSETLPDGRLFTPMGAGPPKVRRRTSSAAGLVTTSSEMRASQKERVRRWWSDDTKRGVLPFEFPNQALMGRRLLTIDGQPILTNEGVPLLIRSWWLVRFGENPPAFAAMGADWWRVTFALLILRRRA